ncbi:hypothetical protein ALQ40_200095 [Pseudomonas syringae]|nr:hypothetical protein ALQ40_200095 [Pseudomonas syringae]
MNHDIAVLGLAQCPLRGHVGGGSIVIRHVKLPTFYRPASPCKLVCYVYDSSVSKEIGRIWIMNTRQGHFRHARIPFEVGQEMPSASGAFRVREIDSSFPSNVMLKRHAFEIKTK